MISTLSFTLFKYVCHPCVKVNLRTVVRLSFKILGDQDSPADLEAPPIFILHDLLESRKQWEGLGRTILTLMKRPVVAVDLRNHGWSPHDSSHKYKELAEDVLHLISSLEMKKASLIGYSMGGMTSVCASLMAPDKIAGILVIDISPVSVAVQFTDFYPKVLATMQEINFSRITKMRKATKTVRKKMKNIINDEVTMKALLSNIQMKSNGRIGWRCNVDALLTNVRYLARIPRSLKHKKYLGPALFIGGQLSDSLNPDDLPAIREMFPQAVITYLSGTGHHVHEDDPHSFLELAIAFIRTNKSGIK